MPIFLFLGIFSARYRRLAVESLECMFHTITFRKCRSGLDDRIKSDFTGKLMKFSPFIGGFFYKNYKIISWVILILFLWAGYASAVGIYNYINYGNCNGPDSTGFCLLDPTGTNSGISTIDAGDLGEVILPSVEEDDPIIGPENAELTIIEFGCFTCPYTKKAESVVSEVVEYYDGRVNFQFKNMILPTHKLSYEAGLASNCALEQGKYKEYHDKLFAMQGLFSNELFISIAGELGLDESKFMECFESEKYGDEVKRDNSIGLRAGVSGTPTFFINDKVIVGPKPFKTFKNIINKELELR